MDEIGPLRKKMGRKKILVDFNLVEGLCHILCTKKEISYICGVSDDTLSRRIKKKYKKTFAEYYEEKSSGAKANLRRTLFQKAKEGNIVALIFLSKNYLGMTDRPQEQDDKINQTQIINFTTSFGSNVSDEKDIPNKLEDNAI